MTSSLLASLAVKSITTAAIVLVASFVARRAGAFWGAVTASLPVSVGPAYLFLALQHDVDFLETTTLNSALASAGTAAFLYTYARVSNRSLSVGLGLAVASWVGAIALIRMIDWQPATVILLNFSAFFAAIWLTRRLPLNAPRTDTEPSQSWLETFLQAMCIAAFVAVLVLTSNSLGPELSGFVAVFPVSLASVIVLSRVRIGQSAAAAIAPAALRIMPSYPCALLAMHLSFDTVGHFAALAIGLTIIVLWSISVALLFGGAVPRTEPAHDNA